MTKPRDRRAAQQDAPTRFRVWWKRGGKWETLAAIVIGLIVIPLVGSIIGSFDSSDGTRAEPKVGSKAKAYSKLSRLAAGTNSAKFDELLGTPDVRRRRLGDAFVEKIYVDPLFYVQSIEDRDGTVVLYSVTTRDRDFRPVIPLSGPIPALIPPMKGRPLRLLDSHFTDARNDPVGTWSTIWAMNAIHSEAHYDGLFTNHQFWILTTTTAGYSPTSDVVGFPLVDEGMTVAEEFVGPEYQSWGVFQGPIGGVETSAPLARLRSLDSTKHLRARAEINTYSVSSSLLALSALGLGSPAYRRGDVADLVVLGPDPNAVSSLGTAPVR